jgi:hypothetical protein
MNTYRVYYYGILARHFHSRDEAVTWIRTRCADGLGDTFEDYEILDGSDEL